MSTWHSMKLILRRLRHLIFGYDFFISYAHSDGKEYAVRLERALAGMDFAVFRDESELSGGAQLSRVIRWTIRRTRCLLVLGTRNSITSRWVTDEVKVFKARRRDVVPLDLHGISNSQPWFLPDEVLFNIDAESDQGPSDSLIKKITTGRERWRVHRLARWAMAMSVMVLLALTIAAVTQRNLAVSSERRAIANERTAIRNFHTARARELAAASISALDAAPQRAILLALEASAVTRTDGTIEQEADRALRLAIAAVAGTPIGRPGPIVPTETGAVSWDGGAVVWWNLNGRPTPEVRMPLKGFDADLGGVSLKVLAEKRVLVISRSRAVVVAPDGAIVDLVSSDESPESTAVLADAKTLLVRTCKGCPDLVSERGKRGKPSPNEKATFSEPTYQTIAWTFAPEPRMTVVSDILLTTEAPTPLCGELLVVAREAGTKSLWRWTGESLVAIAMPDPREGPTSAWAMGSDCRQWISGSAFGVVRVWDTGEPNTSTLVRPPLQRSFLLESQPHFSEVLLSPAGESPAAVGAHASGITALGFVGSKYLVIGSADGTVDLRTIGSAGVGDVVHSAKHAGSVTSFVASPDAQSFATWSGNVSRPDVRGKIAYAGAETTRPYVWWIGGPINVRELPEGWTRRVEFAARGEWLAIESRPPDAVPRVSLWRVTNLSLPQPIRTVENADQAKFTNSAGALLVSDPSGRIQRLELSGERITRTSLLKWHEAPIETLVESLDGTRIISVDSQKRAALWRFDSAGSLLPPSGSHARFHHPDGSIMSAVVADDGRWLAMLSKRGRVVLKTRPDEDTDRTLEVGSSFFVNDDGQLATLISADPSGDKIAVVMQTKPAPTDNLGPTQIDILDVSSLAKPVRYMLTNQVEGVTRIGMLKKRAWLWVRLTDVNNCMTSSTVADCPRARFWWLGRSGPRAADREFFSPDLSINNEAGKLLTSNRRGGPVDVLTFGGAQPTSRQLPLSHLGSRAGSDPTGEWAVVYGKDRFGEEMPGLAALNEPSRFVPIDRLVQGFRHGYTLYDVWWAPNGSHVALRFFDAVAVINTTEAEPVHLGNLPSGSTAGTPIFAPDGSWVTFSDGSCFARLSLRAPPICNVLGRDFSAAVGAESTWFVAGYKDGAVRLWNTSGPAPASRVVTQFSKAGSPLVAASNSIFAVAASGKLEVWSVKGDDTLKLWEETLASPIETLTVSRSGVVWVTTLDGDLHIWSNSPADLNAAARVVIGRGFTREERDRWAIVDPIPGVDTWWR